MTYYEQAMCRLWDKQIMVLVHINQKLGKLVEILGGKQQEQNENEQTPEQSKSVAGICCKCHFWSPFPGKIEGRCQARLDNYISRFDSSCDNFVNEFPEDDERRHALYCSECNHWHANSERPQDLGRCMLNNSTRGEMAALCKHFVPRPQEKKDV